ncbi:MAG: hypothetical protein HFJ55_00900 [Clostridia bacterium]|nr:hypothetical protein [Clostridia bacterium]
MEQKKYSKISIIILAIIILFGIIVGRRVFVKVNLNKKCAEYFDENNYYMKAITYSKDGIMASEKYNKDKKSLTNITNYKYGNKEESSCYKDGEQATTIFRENDIETKTVDYEVTTEPITHYLKPLHLEIMESIFKGLKTGECNGKECYILESKKDNNTLYIDKKTGLVLRAVNDNNGYHVNEYEYNFNIVKDEDIQKPE